MKNSIHNPLPASLSSECKKAAAILESFINPKLKIDGQIPRKIFEGAKGIAIYTAFRVGFLGSIRFGSGLIIARLPDGSWTAPSAMAMGGVGAGGQFGAELTDFVFVLTTDAAVKTFMQSGSLTLGGNISMAVGPIGRSAEASGVVGTKGTAGVFAYSKTRGLYGGLTVEGGVLMERADANKKLYGRKVRATELLSGLTPSPPEAEVLMEVLNGSFFQFGPSQPENPESEPNAESPAQPREPRQTAELQDGVEPQSSVEPQESTASNPEAPALTANAHEEQATRSTRSTDERIPSVGPSDESPEYHPDAEAQQSVARNEAPISAADGDTDLGARTTEDIKQEKPTLESDLPQLSCTQSHIPDEPSTLPEAQETPKDKEGKSC